MLSTLAMGMSHPVLMEEASDGADFYIHELFPINFFGSTVHITTTHVCTLIVVVVIMILALIVIQGAPVFAEMTKYIVTGCAATAMLICHMLMIRKILAVFDLCDGKRKPGRLSDILSSEN